MTRDLLDALRDADPLRALPDTTDAHLQTAHRVLLARLDEPAPARRWRRRLATVLVAAVAVPALGVVAVSVVSDRVTAPLGGVGTAYASAGGLSCGVGYAQPIPPSSADARPWPVALPAGWSVTEVFARETELTGWCVTPSLVAVTTGPDGAVSSHLAITGPARGVVSPGSPGGPDDPMPADTSEPDTVGGLEAEYIRSTAPPVVGDGADHHSWLITDQTGDQWFADVSGYPVDEARALVEAASFVDRRVVWDAAQAPGLDVLHQRTGEAYPTTSRSQDWYVALDDGTQERLITVRIDREGAVPLLANLRTGDRPLMVDGTPMLVVEQDGRPTFVVAELALGVVAQADVQGDLDEVLAMLAGLQDLPADDPRLVDVALPESYDRP